MKFYLSYTKQGVREKPKTWAGATPSERKQPNHIVYHQNGWNYNTAIVDIETFYKIPTSGHSFRQATYKWIFETWPENKRFIKENVLGTNMIILDFDNSPFTPETMVLLAEERLCAPNFWYYSFSQGKKPGFNYRMVWVLDASIRKEYYEGYIAAVLDLFPEADPAAKDISRLWFGGTEGRFIDATPRKLQNFPFTVDPKKFVIDSYAGITPSDLEKISRDNLLDVSDYDWITPLRKHWSLFDRYCGGEYLNYNERGFIMNQVFGMYEEDIPIYYLLYHLAPHEVYSSADNFRVEEFKRKYDYLLKEEEVNIARLFNPIHYYEEMLFGPPKRRLFYRAIDFISFLIDSGEIKKKWQV